MSYSLDHFTELKEVTSLIESIGTICHDNILLEAAEERLIRKCSMFSNLLVLFHLLVCEYVINLELRLPSKISFYHTHYRV